MSQADPTATAPLVAPGAVLAPGLIRSRLGKVAQFDVDAGLGEVISDDGESFAFHCSAIAGGARVIDVGATVAFSLIAFHGGDLQASDLVTVGERSAERAVAGKPRPG